MSENESKPEEGDEYSSKKSESEDNNSIDDEKSKDSVHEQKKEDTFEHSPSASASPFSSDNDGGGGDFANDFGDVSPISKAESPAVDASAPKGRTKKRSSAVSAKVKAKPTKQSKTSSKNASSTKNKKRKIDVFDEFLSPETDGGDSDALHPKVQLQLVANLAPQRSHVNPLPAQRPLVQRKRSEAQHQFLCQSKLG